MINKGGPPRKIWMKPGNREQVSLHLLSRHFFGSATRVWRNNRYCYGTICVIFVACRMWRSGVRLVIARRGAGRVHLGRACRPRGGLCDMLTLFLRGRRVGSGCHCGVGAGRPVGFGVGCDGALSCSAAYLLVVCERRGCCRLEPGADQGYGYCSRGRAGWV
jgi:hypothetical protein